MKKKMLWRDTFREIKNSRNRFISILLIVFLGAGFFVGVKCTAPSIRRSAESYFNSGELFDIKAVSTVGFSDEDALAMLALDGVTAVMPSYSIDVTLSNDIFTAVKVSALPTASENYKMMNIPTVTEGRMPEMSGECIIANDRFMGNDYKIGDKIKLSDKVGETDVTEVLKNLEYEIVGFFNSPLYFSYSFEATTVGNGTISDAIYIPSSEFLYPRYTEVYISVDRDGDGITTFDAAYDAAVADVANGLEVIGVDRISVFKDEYTKEAADAESRLETERADALIEFADAKAKLDEAKVQLDTAIADLTAGIAELNEKKAEAMSEFADAEAELEEAKKTIEENRQKIADAEVKYAEAKQKFDVEFDKAKRDLDKAKRDLDKAKKDYDEGLAEFETQLAKFNAEKKKYDDGLAEYNSGKAEYDKGKAEYDKGVKDYNEGLAEYNKGLIEYADGFAEYEKNYATFKVEYDKYTEGLAEYEKGLAEYEDGKKKYDENKALYDTKLAEYEAGKAEYEQGLSDYNAMKSQLSLLKQILTDQQYAEVLLQLQNAKRELDAAKLQLDAAEAELKSAKMQLDSAKKKLDEGKEKLDKSKEQLADAWDQLKGPKAELDAAKAELDAANKKLDDYEKQLETAEKTLADSKVKLAESEKKLADGKAELDRARPEIEKGQKAIDEANEQIESAKAKIESGEKDYKDGLAKYDREYAKAERDIEEAEDDISDGKAQIADAEVIVADREAELEAARADVDLQFADAQAEIDAAQADVDRGQADYDNGLADYNTQYADFEVKIADAESQIESLKTLLSNADSATYIPMTRDDAVTLYTSLCDDCGRLDAIVNIFPVFFLAVACLVCLTTMTRMVDEQRTQMGTYKALGYSSSDTKKKFLIYALSASIVGGVLGIAICVQILPRVIYGAYTILYQFGDGLDIVMMWDMAAISMLVSVLCIVIITEICSRRELKITTAALMRPKAPKSGKKILLERIGFFWNHIGFEMKVTLRNLFRYKLRLTMTVIGIAGCMMLMVAGFGLQNSILAIVDTQYGEILTHDFEIVPTEEMDEASAKVLSEKISGYDFIEKAVATKQTSINVSHGDLKQTTETTLYVPDRSGDIDSFVFMYPLGTNVAKATDETSPIKIGNDGVVITEKLAKLLEIKEGDTITITLDNRNYDAVVADICKNYVLHYVYMSADLYEEIIGDNEPLRFNRFIASMADGDEDHAVTTLMEENDDIIYVGAMSAAGDLLSDMVDGLNMVVIVMILCAGALAFLVVYNLTNINISERIREIATIKVLGFKPLEANMYVFRENIIMCILGILIGSVGGYYLAQFMITTVEVNSTIFEKILPPSGFIYSALLTIAFTLFVSLIMTRRVKSISMVESLKAIE